MFFSMILFTSFNIAGATTWTHFFHYTSGLYGVLMQVSSSQNCANISQPFPFMDSTTYMGPDCGTAYDPFGSKNGEDGIYTKYPMFVAIYQSVNSPNDHYMMPLFVGTISSDGDSLDDIKNYSGVANIFVENDSSRANFTVNFPGNYSGNVSALDMGYTQANVFRATCDNSLYKFDANNNTLSTECYIMNFNNGSISANPVLGASSTLYLLYSLPGVAIASDSSSGQLIQVFPGNYSAPNVNCNIDYWNGSVAQLTCNPNNSGSRTLIVHLPNEALLPPNQIYFMYIDPYNINNIRFIPVYASYSDISPYDK